MITDPPQKAPVYFGYDAEMYVADELLEECRAMMPDRVVIIGAGENRQLALYAQCPDVIEPRYIVQDAPSGPRKGKGQRKAYRGSRWS